LSRELNTRPTHSLHFKLILTLSLLVPSAILLAQNNADVFKRSGSPTPGLTNADIFKPLRSPTPAPEGHRPFEGVQIDTQTGGVKIESQDHDFDRGLELATSGHPSEALDYFARSLRTRPTNPVAHLNRAEAFYQLDDYQHEIEECNKAIELSKAGWVSRDGHSVKVENNSDQSINHDLASAYASRGKAKWNLKQKQSAVADFDEAIHLGKTNDSTVYCYRGEYYFDEGNLDNALRDFNAALTADPNSALAYGLRALVELKQGKDALAAADLYRAGQIDPKIRQQCAEVADEIRAARGK
jgi:tetratricopeptide (TPR) repeat protein